MQKMIKTVKLNKPAVKNSALVFIMPHAVTYKVKQLTRAGLEKRDLKIIKEGAIKADVVDKENLIDQHYYAIAPKPTFLKPERSNVPEDKFQAHFGLSWRDAFA